MRSANIIERVAGILIFAVCLGLLLGVVGPGRALAQVCNNTPDPYCTPSQCDTDCLAYVNQIQDACAADECGGDSTICSKSPAWLFTKCRACCSVNWCPDDPHCKIDLTTSQCLVPQPLPPYCIEHHP